MARPKIPWAQAAAIAAASATASLAAGIAYSAVAIDHALPLSPAIAAERHTWRSLIFMIGIATFGAGSIVVGASSGVTMIIIGRVIQGVGAAMASPSTLSILSVSFTGRSRSIAFGIWGATAGAGRALGPLLGGFFTTDFTWRLAFLINVPIAAAAIIGALLLIPESKDETSRHTLDLGGIVLASIGFAALVLGFIEAPTYGWVAPSTVPFSIGSFTWATTAAISLSGVAFVVGVVALVSFVAYELALTRRGKEPLFDFRLLRYIGFRYGLLTVSVVALGEWDLATPANTEPREKIS
jgi:MFS family permease